MSRFTLHTLESAPDAAKASLKGSLEAFGMIPNLHAVMAESPPTLRAYQQLHGLVLQSSFTDEEKTVVWQTINVEHGCAYCVPAHSAIARSMDVPAAIDDALRERTPLPNSKLEALRSFTLAVLRERGRVPAAAVDAFVEAGYGNQQILEVVLILSQKVMSNYINHLAQTPGDEAFRPFAWAG